jgi:hypothetical protein
VIHALLAISVSRSSSRGRLSKVMSETNQTTQPEDRTDYERTVLLLTMIDAARALSIGRTTMYELVCSGQVEVVHIVDRHACPWPRSRSTSSGVAPRGYRAAGKKERPTT